MKIKYAGKKFGGYVTIQDFRVKYYFYWINKNLDHGKVLGRVLTNI